MEMKSLASVTHDVIISIYAGKLIHSVILHANERAEDGEN